jgi:hypothetical protein
MARKKQNGANVSSSGGPVTDEDGFEVLGGDQTPLQVGECIVGTFGGIVRTMPGRRKGTEIPVYQIGTRSVLGTAVLINRITEGKVSVGDTLKVTRLEDAAAKKGQNPAKLYDVRVKRAS